MAKVLIKSGDSPDETIFKEGFTEKQIQKHVEVYPKYEGRSQTRR